MYPFREQSAKVRKKRLGPLFCFLFVLAVLLPADPPAAFAGVTAIYRQAAGSQLTVEIHIGSPAPSSLILVQRLPPGTGVVRSSPPANSVNIAAGEIKWLLHAISPGNLLIEMNLDRAVGADEVSAEIRFKRPEGGGMHVLPVAKP